MGERRRGPLAWIGQRLGGSNLGEPERARASANAVRDLVRRLELPSPLGEVGVPQTDLASFAEAAYPEGEEAELALELLRRMWWRLLWEGS